MTQARRSSDTSVRVALVTGANRGIGFEVCRQLATRGFAVLLTARDAEKAQSAANRLAGFGQVEPLVLDVADQDSIDSAANKVASRYGYLDVLVNNAGINYDAWETVENADIIRYCTGDDHNEPVRPVARLPGIPAAGRIVNVSSESGSLAEMGAGPPAYQVTKAALNALTRTLAGELRETGILVNAVCPGWARLIWVALVVALLLKVPQASFRQRHCPTMVPLVVSSATVSRSRGDTRVPALRDQTVRLDSRIVGKPSLTGLRTGSPSSAKSV